MPEISRFFGMVVAMYYNDHEPPHFRVRYGDLRGLIAIDPPGELAGNLPPKALTLVLDWAAMHRDELLADWQLAREQAPLHRIAPLE